MKLTPRDIMQNPNYYLLAPTAMLGQTLEVDEFIKYDEEGVATGMYYTLQEFVEAGGHTIERTSNDGSMFYKGFCVSMETADAIRAMLPAFGLTYGTDLKFVTGLTIAEELAKPEWVKKEIT